MLNSRNDKTAVLGIYSTRSAVDYAVDQLKLNGFRNSDISVLMPTREESVDFAHEKNTKAAESVTNGATSGALLGGGLGWLVGMGSLAIPGIGPFIAAGPIMAALAGMGMGGAVGGIAGALIGAGIPEERAKHFESKVKEGSVLLSVHVEDFEWSRKAKEILEHTGARDIASTTEETPGLVTRTAPELSEETSYLTMNSANPARDDLLSRKQF